MKKGTILENIFVEKLIFGGKWLAESPDGKKIIITGGVIPESYVDLRILKNRSGYLQAQVAGIVKKSPYERELPEDFQVYGGCKWLPIPYEKQLEIKEGQIKDIFRKWDLDSEVFHPIVPSPEEYGYRNKVEFSWGKYISFKEQIHEEYRFGFHAQGSFDRIIDCHNCVLADASVNTLFKLFDTYARESSLPTYDQKPQEGFWRHLVIRQAKNAGQMMVTLSINTDYFTDEKLYTDFVAGVTGFVESISDKVRIDSFYILKNNGKADIVDGEFVHISGLPVITETLTIDGQKRIFEIAPKSFFQTNTSGAQKLYEITRSFIKNRGGVMLDLYAGTGTIGVIIADLADKVYSVELVESASRDNKKNITLNNIDNIEVINSKVEKFIPEFQEKHNSPVDTIVIDPPRAGMHPSAPENIIKFTPRELIYVSCNPSTLERDLQVMMEGGDYKITDIVAVDMFPHTHHVETVVRLERI